jgi:hypothetical protein
MTATSPSVDEANMFAAQAAGMLMLTLIVAWLGFLVIALAFCRAAAAGDVRRDS